jgi:hypothetical protein
MSFTLSIGSLVRERIGPKVASATDFCLKKSVILALFARHMHVLGERLNLHTAAIKRLGEHSADLQYQVDLITQSMELMIQAKGQLLQGARLDYDEQDELPN